MIRGIATIVEGDGEVAPLPVLLRRIFETLEPAAFGLNLPRAFRYPSGSILKDDGLERAVAAVHAKHPQHAVLLVLDCEDDCPRELGPQLLARGQSVYPAAPFSAVLAYREFETWFLAAAESLAGSRGFGPDLCCPPEPEAIRDAKGWLSRELRGSVTYQPTQDQAALTQLFDLTLARERSRSFRKLWKEVESLVSAAIPKP